MKKKLLSVLLSVSMVLTMAPAVYAAGDTLPAADENGVITLTEDVEISDTITFGEGQIEADTLDLNGFILTVGRLDVKDVLTVQDSVGTGKITSDDTITVVVWNGGELNIDGGTFDTEMDYSGSQNTIYNMGTVNMNGGTIKGYTGIYNSAYNNGETFDDVECNLYGGSVELKDPGYWGVVLMGPGMNADGTADNDAVVVNMYDGFSIIGDNGSQGIATNASNGAHAGFTFNMYGGTIEMNGADGCGMYLPAYGEVNVSGGHVKAEQGIRIAAGELNITGGTIEGTALLTENTDLVNGGSGGTQGAIVIGKASVGYPGDLTVNISEDAEIINTADGEGVKPTIVVSDKNMANDGDNNIKGPDGQPTGDSYQIADNAINVNIGDVTIDGDIVKVSNISGSATEDGGNTNLKVEGTTVNGNVINQSKEGSVEIVGGAVVNGNVTTKNDASVYMEESTVEGTVSTEDGSSAVIMKSTVGELSSSNAVVVDSTVAGEPTTSVGSTVAIIGSTPYDSLADALANAEADDVVVLVADADLEDAVPADVTLRVPAGITLNVPSTAIMAVLGSEGVIEVAAGAEVAFDGTVLIGDETANVNLQDGTVEVTIDGTTINLDFKGADVEVPAGKVWTMTMQGLQMNASLDKNSTLTVNGDRFQVANNAELTNSGKIVVNTMMIISSEGKVTGSGSITVNENGKLETKKGAVSEAFLGVDVENYGVVAIDGTNVDSIQCKITVKDNGVVYSDTDIGKIVSKDRAYADSNKYAPYDVATGTTTEKEYAYAYIYYKVHSADSSSSSSSSSSKTSYDVNVEKAKNGSVSVNKDSAKKDSTVTITVKPDEGYVLDSIKVTDEDGDKVKVTDEGNGKYTFTMPKGEVTIKATFVEEEPVAPEMPFVDVAENDYYYDAVLWAITEGVTGGTSATTFSPEMVCNRAQMVTFLWSAAGSPKVEGTMPFTDVAADAYYYDAVVWAVSEGITGGTSATTFSPDQACTRAQMATFLWNSFGSPVVNYLNPFTDVTVGDYYYNAVMWAVSEGITGGTSATTYSPDALCQRCQIVTFLYHAYGDAE